MEENKKLSQLYLKIKELLELNLGKVQFQDICDFIESLYLMDYDVLILMARKFFNFFYIFHQLNCEKYRQLDIPYENKGKIVTNRALPLLKNRFRSGDYKKVIIADDIIIHGRGIREVYDEVMKCNPGIEAYILSYMINDEKNQIYEDIQEKISPRYLVGTDEWRDLSNKIVLSFYLSGRPYISYLPFFTLDISWDGLKSRIKKESCTDIGNDDMLHMGMEAFICQGEELRIFTELDFCEFCLIRFYYYSNIDKVVAIPYFMMRAIDSGHLWDFLSAIRKDYFTAGYQAFVKGSEEMETSIMELEYAFSAWAAMYFFDRLGIRIQEWHQEIEDCNFVERLLPSRLLNATEVTGVLGEIQKLNLEKAEIQAEEPKGDEFKALNEAYKRLKKKYSDCYSIWKQSRASWKESERSGNYVQRFFANFMARNGAIDENQCQKNIDDDKKELPPKRLYGMPMTYLLQNMVAFFSQLGLIEQDVLKLVCTALITEADSGGGTIVTRKVLGKNGNHYYESLIYAGEQNYKFYEETNFPGMYGLYLIEQKTEATGGDVKKRKADFVKAYMEYMKSEKIFCIEEEMLQLARLNMRENYGRFLQSSYYKNYNEPVVKAVVAQAIDICSN